MIGLVAALVLAVVGGGLALQARDTARRQALSADARRLAAEALNATDLRTELLLAVAGYRLQDSPVTRSALLSALERNGAAKYRFSTPDRLFYVSTDATADTVWAADHNGNVLRYDTRDRHLEGTFRYVVGESGRVARWAADGRHVGRLQQRGRGERANWGHRAPVRGDG